MKGAGLIAIFLVHSAICDPLFQNGANSSEGFLETTEADANVTKNNVSKEKKKIFREEVYVDSLRKILNDILKWVRYPSGDEEVEDGGGGTVRRRLRCVAVIGDSSHVDLLGLTFRTDKIQGPYGPLSSFAYKVDDKEDLQNPDNKTLMVWRRTLKEGCGVFVILMSDGNRTGRLLRYGDRYRELDTRAKFVLLYDSKLFLPEFQHLWGKIVNVIFLRAHVTSTPWFELLTVSFPLSDNKMKLVDVWSRGEFRISNTLAFKSEARSRNNLFPEKTKKLQGKTLAVFTFDHVPSAIKKDDGFIENSTSAFHGIEIRILETLAEFMDFRIQLTEIGNEERWGSEDDNGNWTGLLGAVSRGEADIALGNLFYTPYYLDKIDLTIPYTAQCLTFLTPESRTDNSWVTLLLPFKAPTWGAIISTLIVGGFLFRFISALQVSRERTGRRPDSRKWKVVNKAAYPFGKLDDAILYSWGMLLQVSPPTLPSSWPLRLLSGCWWLFCLLMAVAYRSSMTAVLSSPPPRLVYDTLIDLAASGFSSGGWGEQPKQFFSTALDAPSRRLAKHLEAIGGAEASPQSVASRVAGGHFAYYENEYWLRDARAKYLRGDGRNGTTAGPYGLHVMRECAINMPISVGLRDNSPLKARVDQLLRRVVEAGLIGKWLSDAMKPTLVAERNQVAQESPEGVEETEEGAGQDNSEGNGDSKKALMNLRKMYGALFALGLGYLMGFTALVAEIAYYRRSGKKKVGIGSWINNKRFQKGV